ncbi:MAG: phosphopantetheine-binding protein [Variovorax sp.]|nr:phosphopantetheine-binding protein [Variovorax sp.]
MTLTTFDRFASILEKDFRADPLLVLPSTALAELGLDSLALMEFVFAVEDEFELRIPEDRLDPREAGITLQRLCEVIDELVAARPEPATKSR